MAVYLWLRNLLANEEGQDLVEYALIIALVSVVLGAALTILSGDIEGVFTAIGATLAGG